MARKARHTLKSNLVLVTQKSNHPVFRHDEDRHRFLSILEKVQVQYDCAFLAFCCAQDNAFQLVIDTQGANLSRILQSITIAYVMYRKSDVKLFDERYKSVALDSMDQLKENIQNVGQVDSQFAACCFIKDDRHPWIKSVQFDESNFTYTQRLIDQRKYLNKWLSDHNVDFESLLADKDLRNQAIKDLRQNSNCTLKKLATAFKMSESNISKILRVN